MSIFSGQEAETTTGAGLFVPLSQKKDPVVEQVPTTTSEEIPTESHGSFGAPAPQATAPETVAPVVQNAEIKTETPRMFGQGVIAEPEEKKASTGEIIPPLEKNSTAVSTPIKTPEKSLLEMTEEEKLKNISERAEKVRAMLANAKKEMEDKGLQNSFMFGVIGSAKASFDTLRNDVENMGRGTSPQFAVKLNSILSGLPADIAKAEEDFKKTAPERNKNTGGAVSVPLSSPSIDKKVGGGDIKPKMPTMKQVVSSPEEAPRVVVYGRPGTVPVVQPEEMVPTTEPDTSLQTPPTEIPTSEQVVSKTETPITTEPAQPTSEIPPKKEEVVAPILETGGDAAPGVNRLLTTLKSNVSKFIGEGGSMTGTVAAAVMLSTSAVPEIGIQRPQPKPVASAPTNKETPSQTSLSPEERTLFSSFATKNIEDIVSFFGLDGVTYNAVCEKMKAVGITPYKMLHDGSFTTFEVATANGNRDVRKEISNIIAGTGSLASKLGIQNPVVTEYSNESLEQYLARLQDVVRKSVARTS